MLINICCPAGKKIKIEPCPKHNTKCNGYNGKLISFNGNYNGVYLYVMDYIGGMLNPVGEMPKKSHYKREFCYGFTGKKIMVYNVILIETIGISVNYWNRVSIGLLFFFLPGWTPKVVV